MDKLPDGEIVKALENCQKPHDNDTCKNCKYKMPFGCRDALCNDILGLINRTKGNENHYRRKIQNQKEELKRLNEVVNRLQADCENYKQVAENQQKITLDRGFEIKELKAENERLKGHQKDGFFNLLGNCLVFSKTLKDYNDMRKGLKAEAYKEFAERSEKEIFIKQDDERKQMLEILKTYRGTRNYSDTEQATDNWLRGYGEAVQDILGVFDNLLKEMVGKE